MSKSKVRKIVVEGFTYKWKAGNGWYTIWIDKNNELCSEDIDGDTITPKFIEWKIREVLNLPPRPKSRKEEKEESRREDERLIMSGEMTAEEVQEKNSILPKDFFKNAKIKNLKDAVGE